MPYDDSNIKKMIKYQTERKVGFSRHKKVSEDCKDLIHLILEAVVHKRATIPVINAHRWLNPQASPSNCDMDSPSKSMTHAHASVTPPHTHAHADAKVESTKERHRQQHQADTPHLRSTPPDLSRHGAPRLSTPPNHSHGHGSPQHQHANNQSSPTRVLPAIGQQHVVNQAGAPPTPYQPPPSTADPGQPYHQHNKHGVMYGSALKRNPKDQCSATPNSQHRTDQAASHSRPHKESPEPMDTS